MLTISSVVACANRSPLCHTVAASKDTKLAFTLGLVVAFAFLLAFFFGARVFACRHAKSNFELGYLPIQTRLCLAGNKLAGGGPYHSAKVLLPVNARHIVGKLLHPANPSAPNLTQQLGSTCFELLHPLVSIITINNEH